MHFSFDTYWPLALLLVIPYLWWVQRRTLTDLSLKHLQLAGMVRSAIVALIALALMQPVIYRSGSWISVVYLIDVSQSVSPPAIQSAIQWVQQTNDAGHPDHARFVPFGANAAVFEKVEQIKQVQVASTASQGSIDQSGTNIENAIDSAIRSFAPHHLKRLVLLSDGNENSGRMMNMLSRLKSEGIHVYTVPSQARTNHDAWVENIMAPAQVTAEELFPLEVHVYSQAETRAEVEIKHGDMSLGMKQVQLIRGLNRIAFETSIKDEAGPVILDAEVRAVNDPFPDNNKFRSSIVVQGRPKILYVESHAQSARYLEGALTSEGLSVKTTAPASIPDSIEELDGYDAIILSDV